VNPYTVRVVASASAKPARSPENFHHGGSVIINAIVVPSRLWITVLVCVAYSVSSTIAARIRQQTMTSRRQTTPVHVVKNLTVSSDGLAWVWRRWCYLASVFTGR